MNTHTQNETNESAVDAETDGRDSSLKRYAVIAAIILAAGTGLVLGISGLLSRLIGAEAYQAPTHEVERELMRVTVTAGGTLQAMESHEVKSEVEGSTQILEIIPEGTIITEEDVERGTVLMQLDASDARDRVDQQEIEVQDAKASYTQAEEDYTIQKEQNESDISEAERRVRFARLELERYLGDELAGHAIKGDVDFESSEWQDQIGGAALQRKRRLENDVSLAEEELSRTEESLHWTRELVDRGYVNRNELVADELQKRRREVELESAREELELFLRYTLVKETEERVADYREAKRNLERTKARARGRLAQAEANLRSRKSSYNLRKERLENLYRMIENSTVRATRPGLIVYASTTDPRRFRDGPVQEGLSVREGQTIMTIPDLSTLAARVDVAETQARMVNPGQPAEITVDAVSDRSWGGEVRRISPMTTQLSGFRALTGGSSGYETDVAFSGSNDEELKPGMSATAEIEAARIPEALKVPIHAVHTRNGRRVCWVVGPDGPKLREVELGLYTDTHVEIRRGLQEGDRVYLTRPEDAPRRPELVELPEKEEPEGNNDEVLPEPTSEPETAPEELDEKLLEDLDPETRRRILDRFEEGDAEVRSRIIRRLQDAEDPADIERRGEGTGDGAGRGGGGGRGGEQ